MPLDDPVSALAGQELVVKDLDHARTILRETVGVKWGEKIKHSEPAIIVACAMVCHEVGESLEAFQREASVLREQMDVINEERRERLT